MDWSQVQSFVCYYLIPSHSSQLVEAPDPSGIPWRKKGLLLLAVGVETPSKTRKHWHSNETQACKRKNRRWVECCGNAAGANAGLTAKCSGGSWGAVRGVVASDAEARKKNPLHPKDYFPETSMEVRQIPPSQTKLSNCTVKICCRSIMGTSVSH